MNLFKSLLEKVVAPSPAKVELATIDGCFYLVRPTVTVKGAKECLFQTAIAAIRRTSQQYQYELVINRSVTEGEAQLLADDEADFLDEYVSLIDARMRFTVQPASETDSDKPNALALTWLDLAGEEEDSFLIVVENATAEHVAQFELIMYRCMWEREHNADAKNVGVEELMTYKIEPTPTRRPAALSPSGSPTASTKNTPQKPLFRAPSPSTSDEEITNQLTDKIAGLKVSSTASSSTTPPRVKEQTPSPDKGKGKGKAREEPTAPAMYPVLPQESSREQEAQGAIQLHAKGKTPEAEAAVPPPSEALPTREEITNATYDPPDGRTLMISEECDINLYDKATGLFMLQEDKVVASLWLVKGQTYYCWLSVAGKDGYIWVSTHVDGQLPLHFQNDIISIIITFNNKKPLQEFTWLMKFNEQGAYGRMQTGFTQALFETNNGPGAWSKLKPDEQRYNQATYTDDAEMENAEVWNPEEDEEFDEQDRARVAGQSGDRFGEEQLYSDEEEDEEEAAEGSEGEQESSSAGDMKAKNSLLSVGYKGMSFVVRGDMIGVFDNRNGSGKKLKFMTNIAGLKRPGGKSTFVPNKVMLHKQDTTMILSDPLNPHSLYRLDLETGRVVDEWKIGDSISVNNFVPDSKTAQTTGEDTFVGTSHNSIFRIDPRLAGNKLVDSQHREYKTKVDFTSAVTTGEGKLAVATNKGEIKLFDRLGINAKTSLPNLGHAITGIDVTGDGRYIVATTKERLLFIDTKIHEGKNMGLSAFDKPFPADAKPHPHPLRLRPEHAAYVEGGVNFTPAKFNIGEGLERTIVTSTGPYIVTWNFRAVKAGRFFEYKIKRYDEDIVADNFAWGGDREIVVTMPNDMRLETKSSLMAPSRQSLTAATATPRRSGIRRSDAVRHWGDD